MDPATLKIPPLVPFAAALERLKPAPEMVLLVRCAPEGMLLEALAHLRKAWPESRITLLCQPGHEIEGLECIVNPGGGFLRLEDLDRVSLRASGFDLAVVPCSTTRRLAPSYQNIDRIVEASGAPVAVYLFSDRLAVTVDRSFLELKRELISGPYLERKRAVIAELAEYTGEDAETVERKCELAGIRAVRLWHERNPRTEQEVRRYYEENDFYLYELMKTEYNGDEAEITADAAALCRAGERVLEYGGGGGTLSILLAEKGCLVTHLDLPGHLLEYAAWRHRRRGLSVRPWPLVDDSDLGGPYDCIVSLFVLEHLTDPERALAAMRDSLAPGGRMLLAVDFEESEVKDHPLPLHLNRMSRERYAVMTAGLGLRRMESRGALDVFVPDE